MAEDEQLPDGEGAGVLATQEDGAGVLDASAALAAAMPAIPGMDPAAYAQWLQAIQAQQVAAQQLYLQQIAAASAGGGLFAVPQVAGGLAGLPQVAGLAGLRIPGLSKAEGPVYTGQVVDYNEDRGFGFIECKETQDLYGGKDIFLLRSGLNGLIVATGDRVNFRVERGIKGPKAVEVEVVERIQDMADKLPRYYGIIKNFDNTRGLAFIECEETKEVYDKDILALRSQLGDAEEGGVCSFNIVQDARGVKAANVKVHPEGFPPGMEPKPRLKGKGKGKDFDFGKGFGKFGKGFNKGKFEEFYQAAQSMLQDWGWYEGGGDWWGWDGGWDDPSWWDGGCGAGCGACGGDYGAGCAGCGACGPDYGACGPDYGACGADYGACGAEYGACGACGGCGGETGKGKGDGNRFAPY